jgi:hypothetical protein
MSPTPAPGTASTARALPALVAACGFMAAFLAGCGSSIHEAPANLTAEAGEGQVELSWQAVPGARKYTVRWEDQTAGETGFPNTIKDLTDTTYVHTGLIDLHTYRYQVYAGGSGGEGPGSVIVTAEPGPVPGAVDWAVVVTEGSTHKVYFAPATGADGYRVYAAGSADQLAGRRPPAGFVESDASPYVRAGVAKGLAAYYRVLATNGPRIGAGGPIVASSTFVVSSYDLARIAPALADADDDGCLDLVVARNDCRSAFTSLNLATAGLDDLFATGRAGGDARFVDVNADGRPDVFSDVRAPATDAGSRAILHVNQGNDVFQADTGIAALGIGGFGGTVLAADFDNDGDVDIFAPHDWNGTDGGRNWLLVNGGGTFTDAAAAAGLQAGPAGAAYVPGGGQAVDFNEDGRVDILFGSRLMINEANGSFSDGSAAAGLTAIADQGLRLVDLDMDGDLDLLRRDANVTRAYLNSAGVFGTPSVVDGDATTQGAGLAVCDVNSDGFEDLVVASNGVATGIGAPRLYLNVNGQLRRSDVPQEIVAGSNDLLAANDLLSCGDLDGSGTADVVARWNTYRVLRSGLGLASTLRIRVLGAGGEYNQQGRIVKIVPSGTSGRTMARVIESGSGLRAQGDYDLLVGAPWAGDYEISVRFRDGWFTTTAAQGDELTIYEDGRVEDGLQ